MYPCNLQIWRVLFILLFVLLNPFPLSFESRLLRQYFLNSSHQVEVLWGSVAPRDTYALVRFRWACSFRLPRYVAKSTGKLTESRGRAGSNSSQFWMGLWRIKFTSTVNNSKTLLWWSLTTRHHLECHPVLHPSSNTKWHSCFRYEGILFEHNIF